MDAPEIHCREELIVLLLLLLNKVHSCGFVSECDRIPSAVAAEDHSLYFPRGTATSQQPKSIILLITLSRSATSVDTQASSDVTDTEAPPTLHC